jgi:cytochrome c oxidase subunit 3
MKRDRNEEVVMSSTLYLVPSQADAGQANRRTGLWVFMGVVGMLFFLFSCAYIMRMALPDWRPLPFVPWQLWLSSAVLAAASVAWQRSAYGWGCVFSLAFLASQLWAWQAMRTANFPLDANPANSFFYLITGLHALHVAGGLAVAAGARRNKATMQLCARYWHFLLGLWLAMFGLLFWVTPAFVQDVCNVF